MYLSHRLGGERFCISLFLVYLTLVCRLSSRAPFHAEGSFCFFVYARLAVCMFPSLRSVCMIVRLRVGYPFSFFCLHASARLHDIVTAGGISLLHLVNMHF